GSWPLLSSATRPPFASAPVLRALEAGQALGRREIEAAVRAVVDHVPFEPERAAASLVVPLDELHARREVRDPVRAKLLRPLAILRPRADLHDHELARPGGGLRLTEQFHAHLDLPEALRLGVEGVIRRQEQVAP